MVPLIHNVGDFAIVATVTTICLCVLGLVASAVVSTIKKEKHK